MYWKHTRRETATAETIAHGKHLYASYCYLCHGLSVESGGVLPDLRYASPAVHERWNDIVIGGLLAGNGMRSWSEVIDADDAEAIRAYVVDEANKLRQRKR